VVAFGKNPYFVNIVSNLLTLAIIGLVGWVVFIATRRRQVKRFFGVERSRGLRVYVSRLYIKSGTSLGVDGVHRSFEGPAVTVYEAELIAKVQRFFDSVVPGLRQRWGPLRFLRWRDFDVIIEPSPVGKNEVRWDVPVLTTGSPGYNAASRAAEEDLGSIGRFANDNQALQIGDDPPILEPNCCFVQRAIDGANGRVAFYVAGPTELGTRYATNYLLRRWRDLARRYPDGQPFCIVLQVTDPGGANSIELAHVP
jgi:hypothetical protein